MPEELFLTNAVLELSSGVVALAVSITAFRYNRLVTTGLLRYISFGFMLLGVGLVSEGSLLTFLAFNLGRIAERDALVYVASVLNGVLQVAAYIGITAGYTRHTYGEGTTEASALAMLALVLPRRTPSDLLLGTYINAILQVATVALLAIVVFQGILIYSKSRGLFTLLVLTGFGLILLAHIVSLASSLLSSPPVFLAGSLIQFCGFVSLLLFLIRSGRQSAAPKVA